MRKTESRLSVFEAVFEATTILGMALLLLWHWYAIIKLEDRVERVELQAAALEANP